MTLGEIVGVMAQYGLPALAVGVSAWFGLNGVRTTTKAEAEGQVAAEKIKAQTATEERLTHLLDAQRQQFIVPLQDQVNRQGAEIETLKHSLTKERNEKWDAISYVRELIVWASYHLEHALVGIPTAPDSIRHHVDRWNIGSPPSAPEAYSPPTPAEPPTRGETR